jgi:hypothetical protein
MTIIKGTFGNNAEPEKPTAQDCLEQFLEQVTLPAMEEKHSTVDAVVVQLDDYGVSLGSNLEEAAHIVMLLELAKMSILERYLGSAEEGFDGTIH